MTNQISYVSLSRLASRFDLLERYLKELAEKSLIPSLNVSGHRKFNPAAVEKVLARLAAVEAERKRKPTVLNNGGCNDR